MTLTEGLDNIHRPPFLVERETGAVLLNFDPQHGMKGYFDFMVTFTYQNYYLTNTLLIDSSQRHWWASRHGESLHLLTPRRSKSAFHYKAASGGIAR